MATGCGRCGSFGGSYGGTYQNLDTSREAIGILVFTQFRRGVNIKLRGIPAQRQGIHKNLGITAGKQKQNGE